MRGNKKQNAPANDPNVLVSEDQINNGMNALKVGFVGVN